MLKTGSKPAATGTIGVEKQKTGILPTRTKAPPTPVGPARQPTLPDHVRPPVNHTVRKTALCD
jgi:hypothetical protein